MAGTEHPSDKALYTTLIGGYEAAADTIISGIEIVSHPHGINQEDEERIVKNEQRTLGGGNPIGRKTDSQEGYIAHHHTTAEIAGVEQRRMALGDGNTGNVEIRHREGCGQQREGYTPLEKIVQQQTDAEHGKEQLREHAGTVVHLVMAIGIVA